MEVLSREDCHTTRIGKTLNRLLPELSTALLKLKGGWVLLLLSFISWNSAFGQQCSCNPAGFCNPAGCFQQPALSDIQTPYFGFKGGLYGNYSNQPTATQLARLQTAVNSIHPLNQGGNSCTGGQPSNPCKILMLTEGMSIGKFEWLSAAGNGWNDFTSPQIADLYSVIWRLGEAKEQSSQPTSPPFINSYFYAVVGNMNGHFAASWVNDNPNNTLPGDYTQVFVNVIQPQWYPKMFHQAKVQKYIIDSNGNVEEATNYPILGQSGTTPPPWSTMVGGTTQDGSVIWKNDGPQNAITKFIYSFSAAQVQILHISNFTGLQFTQTGTVNTTAGSSTITQTGGDAFNPGSVSDGGWNNLPLVLTNGSSHITCGGKQCVISNVTSSTQLTTTVPVDTTVTGAVYALGVGLGTAIDPVCDGTWWTSACPNWEFLEWLDAQAIREGQVQYPNNKLLFLGGVDYCGYHDTVTSGRDAASACLEPYNYETWLTTQTLVLDQDAEMNSQAALTSCSALHGSETCTATSLPSQYQGSVYIHIAGTSNASLNTPCTPSNCNGVLAAVSGTKLTFSNGNVTGVSNNGFVTIVGDAIAGSLESTTGTAAPIAISEYTWEPGPATRLDGFGAVPPEGYIYDGLHPSSGQYASGCGSGNGCSQAQTCSAGIIGDNPNWQYITSPQWCGQGYLSNQTINFYVSNYSYSSQSWFVPVICAAGHVNPGCN
jgi:hypothetical protein